jgi:L-lactate dehydrogenase complex protein LldG
MGRFPAHRAAPVSTCIVVNMHSAYARPEFRQRRYAVFHSGPSATADIEGVLILGAQGVRSLSVLLAPRNASEPLL